MRTYIITGALATVCVFAYLGLSHPSEIQKTSLIKSEKSRDIKDFVTVPAKQIEPEIIKEVKNPAAESVTVQLAPVPIQNNPVVNTREPSACEIAREALYTVGLDPVAEKVWLDTINNTDTPANERKNLIEDLDTTGFKSHRYPTPDDVALIQSRLAIIDKYAPSATDPVNVAAFQEAKKDLTRMLAKATAQIQPATQPAAPAQPAQPIQ